MSIPPPPHFHVHFRVIFDDLPFEILLFNPAREGGGRFLLSRAARIRRLLAGTGAARTGLVWMDDGFGALCGACFWGGCFFGACRLVMMGLCISLEWIFCGY